MGSWRDVAADVMRDQQLQRFDAGIEPAQGYGLPADIERGLAELVRLSPPRRIARRAAWAPVVADAVRIARDGWAAQALALGWSLHDLFGIGPRDSHEFAGLAVWLDGARLLVLDTHMAVADTESGRAFFNRGGWGHGRDAAVEPVLIWDFGRG